jgi:putative tryptophan/tyrosine transport system substrate-binding protein
MRRREFIAGLGATAAWPAAAVLAQQAAVPVIGYLSLGLPQAFSRGLTAFRRGLAKAGYIDGQNVKIEFRWANNNAQLPGLAEDLVRRQPTVIVANGSPAAVLATMAATRTVPIVFLTSVDPVKYGFVVSLNRPGGNVTGMSFLSSELDGKRLSLLLELAPQTTKVAYLSGSTTSPIFEDLRGKTVAAAQALKREMVVLEVGPRRGFEAAFAALPEQQAVALIVGNFTSFLNPRNRQIIIELAARHKIPAMYPDRQYPSFGGLMSYAAGGNDFHRLGLHYVGQILKGTNPADLPVEQPTKFEFVINLKTAQALGLEVPPTLLTLADEVIQ